jgi:threonine dehydrogenase-like Zn-dependent dehydrogenase
MSVAEAPSPSMRAAVLVEPRRVVVRDVPIPRPGAGQVLVRVQGCGVCASNLPPFEGRDWFRYPFDPGQMGHEGWGTVCSLGAGVTSLDVGDRVATLSNHSYAEYDVGDEGRTVRLPPALDGQPFPAEPLGCAVNIIARSGVTAGQTVAVVGVGFLGAVLIRLVKRAGATVIAVARRPFAQRVAREAGADHVVPMDDHGRIIARVGELTDGRFCPVAIECVGKEWPLNLSAELTAVRGRLVVAGYHQDGMRSVNVQLWNWRGIDLINAHERDPAVYLSGMRFAVDLVAGGAIDPTPLYTHRYPLGQLADALRATAERPEGFLKALVTM